MFWVSFGHSYPRTLLRSHIGVFVKQSWDLGAKAQSALIRKVKLYTYTYMRNFLYYSFSWLISVSVYEVFSDTLVFCLPSSSCVCFLLLSLTSILFHSLFPYQISCISLFLFTSRLLSVFASLSALKIFPSSILLSRSLVPCYSPL